MNTIPSQSFYKALPRDIPSRPIDSRRSRNLSLLPPHNKNQKAASLDSLGNPNKKKLMNTRLLRPEIASWAEYEAQPNVRLETGLLGAECSRSRMKAQDETWPLWTKIVAAATGVFAVGVLVKFILTPGYDSDPVMCSQKEYTDITSTSVANCVPKNMLNFFNRYFPNVVVLGADSQVGQETRQWLDHLGVRYTFEKIYNKSAVPFEVWSHIEEYTVQPALREEIIAAYNKNPLSLSSTEKEGYDKLRGSAACYLNHRRSIVDTINRYDQAVEKLNGLKNGSDFPNQADKVQALEAEVNRYSSIFVLEHNARFGTIGKDGSADLSQRTASEIEKVFKTLPDNWEYFTFFVVDHKLQNAKTIKFPEVTSADSAPLYHPGWGMGAKAYAISHRMYPELKNLFSTVTEERAIRPFAANDLELQRLSFSLGGQRLPQIAPCENYVYRQRSPSFHENAYISRHFPGTRNIKCLEEDTDRREILHSWAENLHGSGFKILLMHDINANAEKQSLENPILFVENIGKTHSLMLKGKRSDARFAIHDLLEYKPSSPLSFDDVSKIVFSNIPQDMAATARRLQLPKEKMVLFMWEPPLVIGEMYSPEVLDCFSKIYTWDDDLVDNIKFFKFYYPDMKPPIHNPLPFSEKKLCTQIIANKKSSAPNELYSERIKAIEFFSQKENDFDFYGRSLPNGYNFTRFKTYRGPVEDKIKVLQQYRFSICYENTKDIKGYVTEKIFDAFQAGNVPVYWGASNIEKCVPKNCFIDKRDFKSLEDLYAFMKNMGEEEYEGYIERIRNFLSSEQAQLFSQDHFHKTTAF